jgi:lipopolysaccharide biosynthesis regulator YciM
MAEVRTLSLKQLAVEINRTYQQIIDGEKKSIEYATEIGEMLIAAKNQHGEHGRWLSWLKAETQIGETTATLYMRIAKKGDELAAAAEANQQRVADLTIRGAAKLLAKPKEDAPHGSSRPSPRND